MALLVALSLPRLARAADPAEPQPFIAAADARLIDETESDAPLRWQIKRPVPLSASEIPATPLRGPGHPLSGSGAPTGHQRSALVGVGPRAEIVSRSETTTLPRAGWNITRIDPSVRAAQALSSDPFSDPFGDRKSGRGESTLVLQPTDAESGSEPLPAPRESPRAVPRTAPTGRQSGPGYPLRGSGAPTGHQRSPLVGVGPRADNVSRSETTTLNAAQPEVPGLIPSLRSGSQERPGVPCDRVYNDRNCCDLETSCHDFRNRLLSDSIRNISLDITPRYSPNLTPEEDIAERTEKLRLLESRTWRDRRGQVVATGRMSNIENGSAVVVDDSGREVARLDMAELGEDELCYVNAWWKLPAECALGGLRTAQRNWVSSTIPWTASALCHKPLYFEEVQLERYGHTAGPIRQPFISGAHFFLNLAALPYNMAINPPHECQYALGYYRPGSCAPWMIPPIPLSLRGAAAETAAVLGGVYLIP